MKKPWSLTSDYFTNNKIEFYYFVFYIKNEIGKSGKRHCIFSL